MTNLTDDLKRILTGLAYQDAGEFLSMHDKMKTLGIGAKNKKKAAPPTHSIVNKPAIHRIALISDGRGAGAPLDYAIETCTRQGAKIDLLLHGTIDTENIATLETHIRSASIDYNFIQLGTEPVDGIIEYVCNHPALIFLVAMPDDTTAKTLIEEVIPKRGGRIPVPLVLIEDQPSVRPANQSAA